SYGGDISGTGSLTKSGAGTLTLTGASSHTGGTTISAGTLQIGNGGTSGSLSGDVTNNSALAFNRSDALTYGGDISGTGSLTKSGTGTLTLTGTSSHTGGTTISAGTLVVNGSTGAITLNGGTLGGSGTVGTVAVNSGGTFAPGNSIGTIAAGNTVFNAGSSYAVEVNADGDSDLLNVTGTVTINGSATLKIAPETNGQDGSTYAKSTDYTIIKASSGVTGTFGTVTDSFAFLDAKVSYDPNKVNVKLTRNDVALKDLATTSNQVATANAVDSLGSGSALYDAVVALEDDKVEAAYDSMSGEAHASAKSFLFQNDAAIAGSILGHMRDTSATGPAPAVTRGIPAPSRDTWGTVFGFQAETEETTDAAEMKRSGGGALAGVNLMTSPDLQLGVTLGVSRSEYDITGRQSSGTATAAHLGIYGSTQRGPLNLRFGATYGYHEIDSERRVTVGATTDDLSASYKAQSATLFAEASYGVAQFEPFINASYTMLDTDGFTESGGASALTVDAASQDMVLATLGVRATHDIMFGPKYASLAWSVAWQHAAGDLTSQMDAAFDGGSKFRIEGVPIATNTAVITAGINVDLGASTSIGFGYTGQFSKGAQRHTLQANLTKSF
ncbi:autotransporter-associated beta strand repeat-containing protein, partial [Sulfitobacter marinus]